jgi:hypothetical protein
MNAPGSLNAPTGGDDAMRSLLAAVPLLLGEDFADLGDEESGPPPQPATRLCPRARRPPLEAAQGKAIVLPRVDCGPTRKKENIEDMPEFMEYVRGRTPQSPYAHGLRLPSRYQPVGWERRRRRRH